MRISLRNTFIAAVVAVLCFDTVAKPYGDGSQDGCCLDLVKRAGPPPIRPVPKRPAPDSEHDSPGGSRPRLGPGGPGAAPAYQRPPAFKVGDRDFVFAGQQVEHDLKDARSSGKPDREDLDNREFFYGLCHGYGDPLSNPNPALGELLAPATQKFGIKLDKDWHHRDYRADPESTGSDDSVSLTFFNSDEKTLLVAVADNRPLKIAEGAPHPFHSEIWRGDYEKDGLGKIKYVICSQIDNKETQDIVREARRLAAPGVADDSTVVTLQPTSRVDGERESFYALAGSDNGKAVFRMMTDGHNDFGNREVAAVHTWGPERGQSGNKLPFIVWELSG